MSTVLRAGMVLAAGLGTRMRPLTAHRPKPLLPVARRTLLDHALARLDAAGIETAAVNAHWHADQVAARLQARANQEPQRLRTLLQREPALLGTGGAVLEALRDGLLPAAEPFAVVNGDSFWLDGPVPALRRLAGAFDPAMLDVLLLVARTAGAVGEVGHGDFAVDDAGRLRRPVENQIVPYLYAGVQVVSPRLFEGINHGAFDMNDLWDEALGRDRIRAIVHDGPWFHLSRPSDLADVERILRDPLPGPTSA